VASQPRAAERYHGDQAAAPGMLDFAVNVRASEPPSWLVDRLAALIVPSFTELEAALAAAGAARVAQRLAALRTAMVAGLTSIGLDVIDGCAPFVLFTVPDAELMRKHLDGRGHRRAAV
jgi:histidinol-phosphate/aromatic aminotransferase/cobyric acid decarboxylase-like protein